MKTYGKVREMVLMIGDKVIQEGVSTSDIKADTMMLNRSNGEQKPITLLRYNEYFVGTQAKDENGNIYEIMTTYVNSKPIHWADVNGKYWEVLDNEL